ncbi:MULTISPECIES: hypothetical protein [Romboutsia]|uniref:Uncharacterized protein n=2 Tax=Romboutsia hominis TaxID=1507512 RepID=A0A2P2BP33_9FIRM|nr:hypothetical protein [Romboutsia hominis]CEI72116.1 Hypothetical protein FRIFI_0569 [Romboutsia hominis]
MMHKSDNIPEGYFEYTVYPLEGLWDLKENGRGLEYLDKNELIYTLMIRQPSFVNDEVFNRAMEKVKSHIDY